MTRVEFSPEGVELITTTGENTFTEVIRWEKAHAIAEAVDLSFAIEDVKSHLSERNEEGDADEYGYTYDHEKYPEEFVRQLAEAVSAGKNDCGHINEAYWQLVEDNIDENERK